MRKISRNVVAHFLKYLKIKQSVLKKAFQIQLIVAKYVSLFN